MNAIVLSIGDELVLGQTVDTNSAWLSREMAAIGWNVTAHVTVGDDLPQTISATIADAAPQCDALLVTGGLGPTKDDLTRDALARVLGQPLEMNAQWLARMEAMFRMRRRADVRQQPRPGHDSRRRANDRKHAPAPPPESTTAGPSHRAGSS